MYKKIYSADLLNFVKEIASSLGTTVDVQLSFFLVQLSNAVPYVDVRSERLAAMINIMNSIGFSDAMFADLFVVALDDAGLTDLSVYSALIEYLAVSAAKGVD